MMMTHTDHACPVLDTLLDPGTMVREETVVRQTCSVATMDSALLLVVEEMEVPSVVTAAVHLPTMGIHTDSMVAVVMATVETVAAAAVTMVNHTIIDPKSSL